MELILTQDLDRSKLSVNQEKLVNLLENLLEELIETRYRYVVRIEKLEESLIKSYLITDLDGTFMIGFELNEPNIIVFKKVGSDVFHGPIDISDPKNKEWLKNYIGQTKIQDELRFKYLPFTLVNYKPTDEWGIVKSVSEKGVFVLFRIQSTAQLCKFEDLEIL